MKKASNVLLTVKPGIKVEGTDNYEVASVEGTNILA
jgi:hypothetical protein